VNRYTVTPGAVDQFNRVKSFTVWLDEKYPFAICKDEDDADQVAAALNGVDPEPEPEPADPDWNLCPRGGDHNYNDETICRKCGHDGIPF
jgi:hypothetical protein